MLMPELDTSVLKKTCTHFHCSEHGVGRVGFRQIVLSVFDDVNALRVDLQWTKEGLQHVPLPFEGRARNNHIFDLTNVTQY